MTMWLLAPTYEYHEANHIIAIVLSSNGNEEVLDREARERRIRTPEIIVAFAWIRSLSSKTIQSQLASSD